MNINTVAKISGLSVRTLHHYDQIGILVPGRNAENDYREYTDIEIDRLQQILFFRECGFSLKQIKSMLDNPEFDRAAAFSLQRKTLLHQKNRIDRVLKTLDRTIESEKGGIKMNREEKFKGFDFNQNTYEDEARKLWGDEPVKNSNTFIQGMSQESREELKEDFNSLFRMLARLREQEPSSEKVQTAMEEMYQLFNSSVGVHYTAEMFKGLGQMYVDDVRFTKNIDAFGAGLSMFLKEAMAIYANSLPKQ